MSDAPRRPPVPSALQRGYLTGDLPAVPGTTRSTPEDFEVDEVPLYEPSGEGGHRYLRIEKRGLTTDEAVRRLSRRLSVPRRTMGYAGKKDARALTRQTISVAWGRGAGDLDPRKLEDEQLKVLSVVAHKNKLKVGHLLGNRFRIRIRGGGPGEVTARAALERLEARGVANYFGLQRFGWERSTHLLGQALIAEDPRAFARLLLCGPEAPELRAQLEPRIVEARASARAEDYGAAAAQFPVAFTAERSLAKAIHEGRPVEKAFKAVAAKQRSFYVAAFQSYLFNTYLSRRLDRIDQVEAGEVVTLHRNGAAFVVEEVAADQPRCEAFEISPSGPCFGRKLLRPREGSSARALEDEVLAELAPGQGPELTAALGSKPLGQRRPLRIPISEVAIEREADDLVLRFFLPKGCYATSVLEELLKQQID